MNEVYCMQQIYVNNNKRSIIVSKGAPENILLMITNLKNFEKSSLILQPNCFNLLFQMGN